MKALNSNAETGLTHKEVEDRKHVYGLNELEQEEKESIWDKIKE